MGRKVWHFGVVGTLGVMTMALTIGAAANTSRLDRERLALGGADTIKTLASDGAKIAPDLTVGSSPAASNTNGADGAFLDDTLSGPLGRGVKDAPDALRPAFEALIAGDHERARYIAQPLAQSGSPAAQHLLGFLFEKGQSVEKDLEKAKTLYRMAAENGDVDARVSLGVLAAKIGDHDLAIQQFTKAAENDDPRAMIRLGLMHSRGDGVEKDFPKAASYFEKAANLNDADGQYHLGFMYLVGRGVTRDLKKTRQYYTQAANQGHILASYNLSALISAQPMSPEERKTAVSLMRKAADNGYPPALTAMGLFAHRGLTDDLAANWFERAAAAGDRQGRFFYAVALAEGDGREMDKTAARKLGQTLLDDPTVKADLRKNVQKLLDGLEGRQSFLDLRD